MAERTLGPGSIYPIGLGCMNLSHGYGPGPDEVDASALLNRALDLGCTHLDTAAIYGLGHNEELLGRAVMHRRDEFLLASKCGMDRGPDGKRALDGRPETLKKTCEGALRRLGTDVIDLYYLHRMDKKVPIEDSVGALADLVAAGKIRAIGLSEVSAATVRRAHKVHPIAAVQSEYSLWSRNVEIGVLETCREIGATLVAFSPLARAFLTGKLRDVTGFPDGDIRATMPRFTPENYAKNLKLLDGFAEIAGEVGCSMAQLALSWLLAKAPHIVPIPGTTRIDHLEENLGAARWRLDAPTMARLEALINERTVTGSRYNAAAQATVDTEEFA
ncbi:aldo/keto reductase [Oceanibacterium hippocampi]|uniref:aldo/keto reductase n=1 Tax=Oceanibacterium hippocampi TaxID=745714 RepID=UPI000A26AD69